MRRWRVVVRSGMAVVVFERLRFLGCARNDNWPARMTMALFRPHEVMKMRSCLPVGSCTCQAYPPPPPGPMDTGFRR